MTSAIVKLDDLFTETMIDDEVLVMSLDSGDFFSLEGTTREIWELIDGTLTRDGLVAELAQIYGSDVAGLDGQVDDFLAQLCEAGLVAFG